jgi:tyrosyl-tRNA synthetase
LMHIGQGLVCGDKIRDLVDAGFDFTIFLADWHSMINNKYGGDMAKIRTTGDYFKHCFTALGLTGDKVHYIWASELASQPEYWERVLRVGRATTAQRVMRALPILGREINSQKAEAAMMFYPCMQAADIFQMKLDVACAGIDQRKAHILAREVGEKLGWGKPVSIHTPVVMGLAGIESGEKGDFDEDPKLSQVIGAKMSKSKPDSNILIHDDPETISQKIRKAYCPPNETEGNPLLEYFRVLVFREPRHFLLTRDPKHGGDLDIESYEQMQTLYSNSKIHPQDLKANMASFLTERLKGVRDYFAHRPELLDQMRKLGAG